MQSTPRALFQLGQQLDSSFAASVIDSITFVSQQTGATGAALDFVTQRMLSPLQGRRPDAETVVIVLLAAPSVDGPAAVQQSAGSLRAAGAHIVVVAADFASSASANASTRAAFQQEV